MGIFDEMVSKSTSTGLILFGMVIAIGGLYYYIGTKNNGWEDISPIAIFCMFVGLAITGFIALNRISLTNYTTNKENTLISIRTEDKDNKEVIMKFKGPDNSIREIKAPVKEKYTDDKKKCNKYSLENIKDGYVIYYISENTDTESKPVLKHVNKTKALKNNAEEDTAHENTRHRTLKVIPFNDSQMYVYF